MSFEKRTFQKKLIPPGERIDHIEQYIFENDESFDLRVFQKRSRLLDRVNNIEAFLADHFDDYVPRIWEKEGRILDRLNYIEGFLFDNEFVVVHTVPDDNIFNIPGFTFVEILADEIENVVNNGNEHKWKSTEDAFFTWAINDLNNSASPLYASVNSTFKVSYSLNNGSWGSPENPSIYTNDNRAVWYKRWNYGYIGVPVYPSNANFHYINITPEYKKMAWLMVYGGY